MECVLAADALQLSSPNSCTYFTASSYQKILTRIDRDIMQQHLSARPIYTQSLN